MAVHVVRHAKAGHRGTHVDDVDDEARPLSKGGWSQADGLVDQLAEFPIKTILTSRYVRCRQSVEPLARALGIEIVEHDALAEEASIGQSWKLIEKLLTDESDVVVCSHGNIVGGVLERVRRRGVKVVAKEWSLAKGSIWRLESDDHGELTRAVLAFTPK